MDPRFRGDDIACVAAYVLQPHRDRLVPVDSPTKGEG
jgi:hypothetical protein